MPSNGTSMRSQRPSRTTTGNLTHLTSNPMEDQATSDAPPLTQDGGNSSSTKEFQLSMRKERFSKSKEILIKRIETLVSTHRRMVSTNNGTLCMLTNGRANLKRESSILNLDSLLREISTLFHNCQRTDTLI
jgi:hypothetical protein